MNEKGFTLTELMAILILLSVVTIISVISVLSMRDKANVRLDKSTETLIISSTKRYLSENNLDVTCVNIETLVNEDYLKEPIVNDIDKNDKLLNQSVQITTSNGVKEYIVKDGKC